MGRGNKHTLAFPRVCHALLARRVYPCLSFTLAFPLGVSRSDGRGEQGNVKAGTPHQSASPPASPEGEAKAKRRANRLSFPQRRKPRLARSTSVMRHTLTDNAQRLRREMTAEERKLWYCFLCRLSVPFNRQKVIGQYIVDFYCAQAQIAVEVDGSQHYEEQGSSMDVQRDAFLAKRGIATINH